MPLHRLVYDATIDDAVDVSLRLAGRTKASQGQIRRNVVIVGVSPGMCVVRSRHFASPAERQVFLAAAQKLAGTSTAGR